MSERELSSIPALPPLFAKATLGAALPGRGEELPDERVVVRGAAIDKERLADYCGVCGFALGDRVPATYVHILAFPLSMALMAQRSFPFPLLGLVHVANRIERIRPLGLEPDLDLAVWAEDLRPHPKGRQFDLVAESSVGGEVVWRGRSTYLRRGGGSDGAATDRTAASDLGDEGTTAAIWKVPGDIGRRYADVSGDRNPIHLHPLTAKLFGFPRAIAHGMWTKARCLAAFAGTLPDAFAVEVGFRAPLLIPGRARLRTAPAGAGWALRLDSPDGEHTHLEGSIEPL